MKVLIIDDDKFIRAAYKQFLEKNQLEVEVAENGEEGVKKAKDISPDIILLDMLMPGMNGFEVLENLSNDPKTKGIPIFVFSALSQDADIEKAKKMGAKKYLPKGEISLEEITAEIKRELIKK